MSPNTSAAVARQNITVAAARKMAEDAVTTQQQSGVRSLAGYALAIKPTRIAIVHHVGPWRKREPEQVIQVNPRPRCSSRP
jgi:hypothetical protein